MNVETVEREPEKNVAEKSVISWRPVISLSVDDPGGQEKRGERGRGKDSIVHGGRGDSGEGK